MTRASGNQAGNTLESNMAIWVLLGKVRVLTVDRQENGLILNSYTYVPYVDMHTGHWTVLYIW